VSVFVCTYVCVCVGVHSFGTLGNRMCNSSDV